MFKNILEMLKIAEQYKGNEVIEIAKGKYYYPKSNIQLFKKALKWQ